MKNGSILAPKKVTEEDVEPTRREWNKAHFGGSYYDKKQYNRGRVDWHKFSRIVRGIIRNNLGKNWDSVFSQLKYKTAEFTLKRGLEYYIGSYIELNPLIDANGEIWNNSCAYKQWYKLKSYDFYVHDGKICQVPKLPKPVKPKTEYEIKISGKLYWRIQGVWYEVKRCILNSYWTYNRPNYCITAETINKGREYLIHMDYKDVLNSIPDGTTDAISGHTHSKNKRQLKTKEIRALGLDKFTLDEQS